MISAVNIDDLISKFLSGEASPEEAMELQDWKQESKSNLDHYDSCVRIFEASHGTKVHSPVDADSAWEKVKSQLTGQGKIRSIYPTRSYLRMAAAIALLVGIGSVLYYLSRANSPAIYYAAESSNTVKLADATNIIIAPHSSVTAEKGYGKNNRLLHLKGSAYFSVSHQEQLPFIVDAGNVFIKDIGTKFNILTSDNNDTVLVKVDEGMVELYDSIGSKVNIKASEKARYIKSKRQIITDKKAPTDTLRFNFTDSKLTDVINTLNKAYSVTVELEHTSIADCIITSRFNNESIETVLSIITETLGFTYEKTNSGFIIKGEKCNH